MVHNTPIIIIVNIIFWADAENLSDPNPLVVDLAGVEHSLKLGI